MSCFVISLTCTIFYVSLVSRSPPPYSLKHTQAIASGFAQVVRNSKKDQEGNKSTSGGAKGDDWFDIAYKELEGVPPPASAYGPRVDAIQVKVYEYLEGKVDSSTGETTRTFVSKCGRVVFLSLILANILAVIAESIPEIDRAVGDHPGNFFDVFEGVSVCMFTFGKCFLSLVLI